MATFQKITQPLSPPSPILSSKLACYFLEDEYEDLTPEQQHKVLEILQECPEQPSEKEWYDFRKVIIILKRDQVGGIINPYSKTCWFNALVQTVFKKANFIEMLQVDSDDLLPHVRKMRSDLLQIIEFSEQPLPEAFEQRFQFNQQFNHHVEAFLTSFCANHDLNILEQQDSFEALRFLLNDLGFNPSGGSQVPSFRTPRFTSQTHLAVGTSLYSLASSFFKDPRVEHQGFLPLTPTSSIHNSLTEFCMNFEELDEDNWVEFGDRKEPTLRASYLIDTGNLPPTLMVSLNRFQTMTSPTGEFLQVKDNRRVINNFCVSIPFYSRLGDRVNKVGLYMLTSATCHLGDSPKTGHYTGFVVNQPDEIVYYDDTLVRQCRDPQGLYEAETLIHDQSYQAIYSLSGIRAPYEGEFQTRDEALQTALRTIQLRDLPEDESLLCPLATTAGVLLSLAGAAFCQLPSS